MWQHRHTNSCRLEPELGWSCYMNPEEVEIRRLEAEVERRKDAAYEEGVEAMATWMENEDDRSLVARTLRRAEKAEAERDAARAEAARLREALEEIIEQDAHPGEPDEYDVGSIVASLCADIARAALNQEPLQP